MSAIDLLDPNNNSIEVFLQRLKEDELNKILQSVEGGKEITRMSSNKEDEVISNIKLSVEKLNEIDLKRLQAIADKGDVITESDEEEINKSLSDDENFVLGVKKLDETDLKRLQNIANKDAMITESDEEALIERLSDDEGVVQDINRLSEVDLKNIEETGDEIINENEDKEIVKKFSRAGRRGSCLIRADSKSDLYTENGTMVNVDLIQPEYKPVTPLSGVVDVVRLTKLIGHGGFGAVYEGWWGDVNVAVKQMIRCTKNDKAKIESFKAELNVVNLSHPNVVNILASTPLDDLQSPYLIMEYVGEQNLQQIISNTEDEVLDTERRLRFSQDIACALQYIHVNGIVHLDVKPSNVLVTPGDRCKLGDFGCCQVLDGGTGRVSPTQRSYITGTFAYRAPELLRGEAPCAKADVYSLGITMWELLSRKQAYSGQNPHVVIFGVVAYKLRPCFDDLVDETDVVELCYRDLVRECWEGKTEDRPSAQDLADTLYLWNAYF